MLFWLGVVLAGIVVPLSVDVECLRSPNPSLFVVGAASTLLGASACGSPFSWPPSASVSST